MCNLKIAVLALFVFASGATFGHGRDLVSARDITQLREQVAQELNTLNNRVLVLETFSEALRGDPAIEKVLLEKAINNLTQKQEQDLLEARKKGWNSEGHLLDIIRTYRQKIEILKSRLKQLQN